MFDNGPDTSFPGSEYLRALQQHEEDKKRKLHENTERNKAGFQSILASLNEAHHLQKKNTQDKSHAKKKSDSDFYSNLNSIYNQVLTSGEEHLDRIIDSKTKKSSPTDNQLFQIDTLKQLASTEIMGFLTSLLSKAVTFAKDSILPNLIPMIQKGIQRISETFSKRVDKVITNPVDFSFQKEAIQTAAQMIYELTPEIVGLLPDALKAPLPSDEQTKLLSNFAQAIQSRFNNEKPPLEFIQSIIGTMKLHPPLIQSELQSVSESKKTRSYEEQFDQRVRGFVALGMSKENAAETVKMQMHKEGVVQFDDLMQKSHVITPPKKSLEKQKRTKAHKADTNIKSKANKNN
jgi:hypothetical protein